MPPKSRSSTHKPNTTQPSNTSAGRKRKASTTSADAARTRKRHGVSPAVQNTVPTQRLDVYVFGTNCDGELGLGDATTKTEIPRPVLNPKLLADTVGVVYVAVGGVHSAALTHDSRILTWGVNDEGALGRDTTLSAGEVKLRSLSGGEDSENADAGGNINLKEATPLPVDLSSFSSGAVFTQLAATDSATFALTVEGLVYGWCTFRGGSGNIGFTPDSEKQQRTPVLISGLNNVVKLSWCAAYASLDIQGYGV